MSDTPRTEMAKSCDCLLDCSRELERELATMKAQRDRAIAIANEYIEFVDEHAAFYDMNFLNAYRAELQAMQGDTK